MALTPKPPRPPRPTSGARTNSTRANSNGLKIAQSIKIPGHNPGPSKKK